MLLQLTARGQRVHRVAGKAADRFRYNEVDLACQCIGNHLLEAFAVLGAGAGNAFIGIDIHELPAVMVPDEVGVVVQLSLIAGLLFLMVRTDAGVSRYLPPALFRDGDCRKPCQGRLDGGYSFRQFAPRSFLSCFICSLIACLRSGV